MATITGDANPNTLNGSAFADTISGLGGNDSITGGDGNDAIDGGLGVDQVNGEAGDDRLVATSPSHLSAGDSFFGGDGTDTLDIVTSSAVNLSSLSIATDVERLHALGAVFLTAAQLGNFERVDTADKITLTGGGVADLTGATVLTRNFFLNSAGNALILSGETTSGHTVNGGNGADTVVGGDHAEGDILNGGFGNDQLQGGDGADVLNGGANVDQVSGDGGDDRLIVATASHLAAGDTFNGGDGTDTLDILTSSPVNLTSVTINADVERLHALGAVLLSAAQLGNFERVDTADKITLTGGGVADLTGATVLTRNFVLSAAGNALILSGETTSGHTVNGGNGADTIFGGDHAEGDILNGGFGNDQLQGGEGADVLNGGGNVDQVSGDGGDDRLVVTAVSHLAAGDTFNGGDGTDTLDVLTSSTVNLTSVTINADVERLHALGAVFLTAAQLGNFERVDTADKITLTSGGVADLTGATVLTRNFVLSAAGNALFLSGETTSGHTVNGGNGADTIFGGDHAEGDILNGGFGNDQLQGGEGADVLNGGGNVDQVSGDGGDDRLVVTAASHLAAGDVFSGGDGTDTLDILTTSAVNLTSASISADIESLRSLGAVLLGAAQLGNFTSVDTAGTITLTGGGVADLTGAAVLTHTFVLSSGGNALILSGETTSGHTVLGGSAADQIVGGDHQDGDLLRGGAGNDVLTGRGGGDVFLFDAALNSSTNVDQITDFLEVEDQIHLENAIFRTLAAGALPAEAFAVGASTEADDRIVYNGTTGELFYDSDGSGAVAAVLFAVLSPGLTLSADNFVVV